MILAAHFTELNKMVGWQPYAVEIFRGLMIQRWISLNSSGGGSINFEES